MLQNLADQIAEKQAVAIDAWLMPLLDKYAGGYGLTAKYLIGDTVETTLFARYLSEKGYHLEFEKDINSMGAIYRFKKGQEVLGELKLNTVLTAK